MIDVTQLPAVNATLDGVCAVLLLAGYGCIRTGKQRAHIAIMIVAVGVALLFLTSYLYYHTHVRMLTRFTSTGLIRTVYFTILISHTILAGAVAFWLVPV